MCSKQLFSATVIFSNPKLKKGGNKQKFKETNEK